jgi:guanosine-3',5'-bis(diphosphate) 3'-pyrophosphohydrolase
MLMNAMDARLDDAIDFAAAKHRGQYRDGDVPLPYITHPLDVLANLRYTGEVTDIDMLVTAVLHDVIEECGVEPDEIERRFGRRARELVEELTRYEPTLAETAGMTPDERWELRSKLLLEEIEKMSPTAQAVKLADRLSNLNEARRVKNGKKLERYNRQTGKILKIIPRKANPGLWDALKRLHEEIG